MLRTCDFDADDGPLEVEEADWDGLSVWIGAIPNHGVCRQEGAGDNEASPTAASARSSTDIFLKLYKITDSLEQELNSFGEGIEPDDAGLRTVCLHASNSWALVTFKRSEDAEAMLAQGLTMPPGSNLEGARVRLLLKRAIGADEAKLQLEEDARIAKQKHEMVVLAVSRIQSWVKRSGQQLTELFTKIDTDGSGAFNVQEFRAGMLSIGLTFTDEVIDVLMDTMDKDGDGDVTVSEFITRVDKFAHEMNESASCVLAALVNYMDANGATVAKVFDTNDGDQSGHLNITEFHETLLAIGIRHSEDTAREVMKELDMDDDGDISLAELTARLTTFRRKRRAYATKVLARVFDYIDKTHASLTRIFARVDSDGTGDLDIVEFQETLRRMGQQLTPDQASAVMSELDIDHSGKIAVSEFLDKLKQAESQRRADMRQCQKLFGDADKNHSGTLDRAEVVWVGTEMGLGEQMKSPAFVDHMVVEIEAGHLLKDHEVKVDGSISPKAASSRGSSPRASPTVSPSASPRGLKTLSPAAAARTIHVGNIEPGGELESESKLTEMFEGYGEVASVTLEKESKNGWWALVTFMHQENAISLLRSLASGQGLAYDLLSEKHHLRVVAFDPGQLGLSNASQNVAAVQACRLGYMQFIAWFLEVGKSYLDKPVYEAKAMIVAPPEEKLRELFSHIDADNSGEADLVELQEGLHHLWPYLDSAGFHRALQAADIDHSGHIDYSEFKNLVDFTIWLNEKRHAVQELEDAFGPRVGETEFYFGCQCLKIPVTDGKARYLFQGCLRAVSSNGQDISELNFNQFMVWAVRYSCITLKFGEPPLTEAQRRAQQCAVMSKELEHMAGAYGDIHLIDLVTVVSKPQSTTSHDLNSTSTNLKRIMTKVANSAIECSQLIQKGIEYSTKQNDSFPKLTDESLRMMVRMCTMEDYFTGQDIISQGEIDSRYYVLRRGCVDVIITDNKKLDENGLPLEIKVASLGWGAGFGEMGLLLATKRNATVRASTPCEVYCLDQPGYETVLALLPEDQRIGPFAKVLNDFWLLTTGPDGSRRESVDYKTYLKSHIRTTKTLLAASEMEEFDEVEERAVAQSDWAEDCARYGMKVTGSLSKPQFFDAMYQLVYLWSEDQNLSYATFLQWIFDNIAVWDEKRNAFMFRKVDQVECVGEKFEKMKEEARSIEAAKTDAEASALAEAEAARAAQMAQQAEIEELRAEETRIDEQRSEINAKLTKLANEEADLQKRLTSLENEKVTLLQRLQSGELSLEEEAEIQARLAEINKEQGELKGRIDVIASERGELKAALLANQHNSQLHHLDKRLSKLEQEEQELQLRLESGELSPEEEADIRARLAEIASEKQKVVAEIEHATQGLTQAEADGLVAKIAAEIQHIDNQLLVLAGEEAELIRRLTSGELTVEEEMNIRARLKAIEDERQELTQQRQHKILAGLSAKEAAIKHKLAKDLALLDNRFSVLDDEEAELKRRLESGNLTPEEEQTARARLNEIAAERDLLQARKAESTISAELEVLASALCALDDEEAELRHRLAQGNLTPEEQQAVRARLVAIEQEKSRLKDRQLQIYEEEETVLRQLARSGVLSAEELQRVNSRLDAVNDLMKPQQDAVRPGSADKDDRVLGSPHADFSSMSTEEIRQWKTERDLRRTQELAKADWVSRVSTPRLMTAPPQWGCGAHAFATAAQARSEWSAYATIEACREQNWVELDCSKLPPKLLVEWHQLRSTLRKSGHAGQGRALAWLSKALREVGIVENREALATDRRYDDHDHGGAVNGVFDGNSTVAAANASNSSSQNEQGRASVGQTSSSIGFPAPFVPRTSLVRSPRQRQQQRDKIGDGRGEEALSCSGAESVLGSVSSPQLGLNPASGVFTSSYQIAGYRTSQTNSSSASSLHEQQMLQLQLGLPLGASTVVAETNASTTATGTAGYSRGFQLGAGQFDMTDKRGGGTFRVCTASYGKLSMGALPTPLLRGPYMEWESPDSPYRTQVRKAAAKEAQEAETEAKGGRNFAGSVRKITASASGLRRQRNSSAGCGSAYAISVQKQNSRRRTPSKLNRHLDQRGDSSGPDGNSYTSGSSAAGLLGARQRKHKHHRHKSHEHVHREQHGAPYGCERSTSFTHLPTLAATSLPPRHQSEVATTSSGFDLRPDGNFDDPLLAAEKVPAFAPTLNLPYSALSPVHSKQKQQLSHRQTVSRSSGFSFEGRARRSPPRPTRNLYWDGPIGTIVRS